MKQGNPNKVSAIVDEIVKNNAMFNLKSPIEKDKEKYSMEKSINIALSELNEVGKKLVLEELAVNSDEKFKGFIDNAGNIDISGILNFTTAVVKVKIEEAQREGINLRIDGPDVVKDTNFKPEDAITMAIISEMISNYENLSDKQKASLFVEKTYMDMSDEDRRRLNDNVYEETKNKNLSPSEREEIDRLRRETLINESYISIIQKNPNFPLEQVCAEIKKIYPEFSEKEIIAQCEKYHRDDSTCQENSNGAKKSSYENTMQIKVIDIIHHYNDFIMKGLIKEAEEYLFTYKDEIPEIGKYYREMKETEFVIIERDITGNKEAQYKGIDEKEKPNTDEFRINQSKKKTSKWSSLKNTKQELNMEDILRKEVIDLIGGQEIPTKDVKEALSKYKKFFENCENDDYIYLSGLSPEKFIETLRDEFSEIEVNNINSRKVLGKLANITLDDKIREILKTPEGREIFFSALDKNIEEIQEEVTPITDTEVEQGVKKGMLTQEELLVDIASVRVAQGEEDGRVNVEILNTEQVELGENSKPVKNISAFIGLINKDNIAESDLEETLGELEADSQKYEQGLQVTQGNLVNEQTNLNQEEIRKEDQDLEQ